MACYAIMRIYGDQNEFDKCLMFYNNFKNVITQIPQAQQIIPAEIKDSKESNNSKEKTQQRLHKKVNEGNASDGALIDTDDETEDFGNSKARSVSKSKSATMSKRDKLE